jgi:hypothetical protein
MPAVRRYRVTETRSVEVYAEDEDSSAIGTVNALVDAYQPERLWRIVETKIEVVQ